MTGPGGSWWHYSALAEFRGMARGLADSNADPWGK